MYHMPGDHEHESEADSGDERPGDLGHAVWKGNIPRPLGAARGPERGASNGHLRDNTAQDGQPEERVSQA